MDVSRELTQIIHALQCGDHKTARHMLAVALRADPQNVQAWLWMSEAADTNEQRRECLLRALAIEPDNQAARARLARLTEPAWRTMETAVASLAAPRPLPAETPNPVHRREAKRYITLAGGLSLTLLVGLVLLLVALSVVVPRAETQWGRTDEPTLHEATLWCTSCEREGQPVILSARIGASFYRGAQSSGLPHGTHVSVLRYRWSALERRYYALIVAEGKRGWVPETQIRR